MISIRFSCIFIIIFSVLLSVSADVCLQEYKCWFENDGMIYDFSGLCREDEPYIYVSGEREYQANICGHLSGANVCRPEDGETYENGVAIKYWGVEPASCSTVGKLCQDVHGNAACCTKDCNVLGEGDPVFEKAHHTLGGVYAHFVMPGIDTHEINPCGGVRRATYHFICDETIEAEMVDAIDDGCNTVLTFSTKVACGVPKDAGHSFWDFVMIFVFVALLILSVAFMLGTIVESRNQGAPALPKFSTLKTPAFFSTGDYVPITKKNTTILTPGIDATEKEAEEESKEAEKPKEFSDL
eukprot:TRINITY_DN782249_c0_g1_i1.p1 TRINITY_DN782249_c0_g1~~TRINITY_DN782249_c0_g1_i1.p1  ORF type:complete len:324 (-),score=80.09 TRINITY_DN782249_c0_g1_i1:237-1130(-)